MSTTTVSIQFDTIAEANAALTRITSGHIAPRPLPEPRDIVKPTERLGCNLLDKAPGELEPLRQWLAVLDDEQFDAVWPAAVVDAVSDTFHEGDLRAFALLLAEARERFRKSRQPVAAGDNPADQSATPPTKRRKRRHGEIRTEVIAAVDRAIPNVGDSVDPKTLWPTEQFKYVRTLLAEITGVEWIKGVGRTPAMVRRVAPTSNNGHVEQEAAAT